MRRYSWEKWIGYIWNFRKSVSCLSQTIGFILGSVGKKPLSLVTKSIFSCGRVSRSRWFISRFNCSWLDPVGSPFLIQQFRHDKNPCCPWLHRYSIVIPRCGKFTPFYPLSTQCFKIFLQCFKILVPCCSHVPSYLFLSILDEWTVFSLSGESVPRVPLMTFKTTMLDAWERNPRVLCSPTFPQAPDP